MTILNSLTDQQRHMVVSLPYRVGVWVSQSDVAGGAEADAQELQVLDNLIHGFSEQVFGSELLQYIMAGTVEHKDQWPDWAKNIDGVPSECAAAVDVLRSYVDDKEVNAYIVRLMEIGEAVALAFREQSDDLSAFQKAKLYLDYMVMRFQAKKFQPRTRSFEEFLYVSPHERKALNDIAKSMGTAYI